MQLFPGNLGYNLHGTKWIQDRTGIRPISSYEHVERVKFLFIFTGRTPEPNDFEVGLKFVGSRAVWITTISDRPFVQKQKMVDQLTLSRSDILTDEVHIHRKIPLLTLHQLVNNFVGVYIRNFCVNWGAWRVSSHILY